MCSGVLSGKGRNEGCHSAGRKSEHRTRRFLTKRRRCQTVGKRCQELPYAMYAVQNMWPTLSEELGVDVEYYQKGNLRLGKTDAHMEKLRNLAANANSLGLDMKIIDGKEVKEICPYLSDEIIGASWCPTDGHANPMLTTLRTTRGQRSLG